MRTPGLKLSSRSVSAIDDGFSTAAGYIGHQCRVEHDISMLIPEIWCRLPVQDRNPAYLIEKGYLEKLADFDYQGKPVLASRLGYRITQEFAHAYLGKIFDNPTIVFDEAMLRPETQDMESYVDGINNIVEAQQRVALDYIHDASIKDACPPLQALLHIMAYGHYQGKTVDDSEIRNMFTRDYLLQSDWYLNRLKLKQARDATLWRNNYLYLQQKIDDTLENEVEKRAYLQTRMSDAQKMIDTISSDSYLEQLTGTLGADWIHH